jgi:hypothetical protein
MLAALHSAGSATRPFTSMLASGLNMRYLSWHLAGSVESDGKVIFSTVVFGGSGFQVRPWYGQRRHSLNVLGSVESGPASANQSLKGSA